MTFLKISTKDERISDGIVYLLVVRLEDGTEVYKIGVTTRKIQERVGEILTSFWTQYRYFPYCKPKRFRTTSDIFEKEAKIHKELAEYRYEFDKKFGGHSECFSGLELEKVVEVYERVVKDKV